MAEPETNEELDSNTPPQPNPDGGDLDNTTPTADTPPAETAPSDKNSLGDLLSDKSDKEGGDTPPAEKKAPDAYKEFTAPEGYKTDENALKCVQEACKDLNLAQPEAQKVFDAVVKIHQEGATNLDKLYGEWEKESEANPAIMDNLKSIETVLEGFNKEAQKFITAAGLHKNPDFLLGIAEIGKHVTEQAAINSTTQPNRQLSEEDAMIENSLKKAGVIE